MKITLKISTACTVFLTVKIEAGTNFERLLPIYHKACIKIAYLSCSMPSCTMLILSAPFMFGKLSGRLFYTRFNLPLFPWL